MKRLLLTLPKLSLGLLLATGVTAAVAASAQPAQANVQVSVGIGGGYTPNYRWYNWRDNDGWHRRWVPIRWAPPASYEAPEYTYGSGYAQPEHRRHDNDERNWDRDRNPDRGDHDRR
jgi:hypothetical protein